MIRIDVHDTAVRQYSGISKRTQKPFTMHFQTVYGHFFSREGKAEPHPQKFELILDKDEQGNAKAYAPGSYLLHPSSVYLDRQGDLTISPRLVPASAAK